MASGDLRGLRSVRNLLTVVDWEIERRSNLLQRRLLAELRQEVQRHEIQYHGVRVVPPPRHLSDEEISWRLDQEQLN